MFFTHSLLEGVQIVNIFSSSTPCSSSSSLPRLCRRLCQPSVLAGGGHQAVVASHLFQDLC